MQTVKIDIYISDLLYQYDCVVVPDFGGFVANLASAKIHPIQHQFIPPSKEISFNKNLRNNDGLLSNHIATRKKISYEEANELIQLFVSQSNKSLNNRDKIYIEKVGTLFLDPERNIQFTAEDKNDFLLDSFGLTAFKALPIQREGAEERIKKKINENLPLIKEEEKKKRKYYWPAAAIILFLMLSGVLLNQEYSLIDSGKVYYSNLIASDNNNALYHSKEFTISHSVDFLEQDRDFKLEKGWINYIAPDGNETYLVVDNRNKELETEIDNTEVVRTSIDKNLRFHVMAGCFSKLSNAKRLVKKLNKQGFNAKLLGNYKNLHAVSFGSFTNRNEAIELLASVRNGKNPDAWLLTKPF